MKQRLIRFLTLLLNSALSRSGTLENMRLAQGRLEARSIHNVALADCEFQVFSQYGEDGIIEKLVQILEPTARRFVEFGVEDYRESNTRFLLQHRNWTGLVMDGSARNISSISRSDLSWRFALHARQAFITRENINSLLTEESFDGDLGLLSIDVDGNDYWIWQAISVARPAIVVIEYNSIFGKDHCVTVPYDAQFNRSKAHYSNQYFGASARALAELGEAQGYKLVAGNLAGSNLFFVQETEERMPAKSVEDVYRVIASRQGRNRKGQLTMADPLSALREMADLPLVDTRSGETRTIRELYGV